MMEAKIRKPAVAGSFYAGDTKELRQDVQNCFSRCKNPLMENVQAVIVPHAGYVFSGVTAASAFAAINPDAEYEHIFLLGPSHHVYLGKASVNIGASAYATPLGNVPVDTALCKDEITLHRRLAVDDKLLSDNGTARRNTLELSVSTFIDTSSRTCKYSRNKTTKLCT